MPSVNVAAGTTSKIFSVTLRSSATGQLATAVANGSVNVFASVDNGAQSALGTPAATGSATTWTSHGWFESGNGEYKWSSPNTWLASANNVTVIFKSPGVIDTVLKILVDPPVGAIGVGGINTSSITTGTLAQVAYYQIAELAAVTADYPQSFLTADVGTKVSISNTRYADLVGGLVYKVHTSTYAQSFVSVIIAADANSITVAGAITSTAGSKFLFLPPTAGVGLVPQIAATATAVSTLQTGVTSLLSGVSVAAGGITSSSLTSDALAGQSVAQAGALGAAAIAALPSLGQVSGVATGVTTLGSEFGSGLAILTASVADLPTTAELEGGDVVPDDAFFTNMPDGGGDGGGGFGGPIGLAIRTEDVSHQPVGGVVVRVVGVMTVATDNTGWYVGGLMTEGTYTFRAATTAGVAFSAVSVAVEDGTTVTLTGSAVEVVTPEDPEMCRVTLVTRSGVGVILPNATVVVQLLTAPEGNNSVFVAPFPGKTYVSGPDGVLAIDLPKNAKYKFGGTTVEIGDESTQDIGNLILRQG